MTVAVVALAEVGVNITVVVLGSNSLNYLKSHNSHKADMWTSVRDIMSIHKWFPCNL